MHLCHDDGHICRSVAIFAQVGFKSKADLNLCILYHYLKIITQWAEQKKHGGDRRIETSGGSYPRKYPLCASHTPIKLKITRMSISPDVLINYYYLIIVN